ncbi:hypothetical protein KY285_030437 [Solanum tuberosum]|nr:hypothetical protein KY285_030437 [Solanum tuberosum]
MPKDNDLHAAEVSDNNVCFSRTLIAIKEPSNVNMLKAKHQDSTEFVEGPDSRKSFSMPLAGQEEAKKNVKELKALRDAAKKEVEDVDSKVLEAEHEFDICAVFL